MVQLIALRKFKFSSTRFRTFIGLFLLISILSWSKRPTMSITLVLTTLISLSGSILWYYYSKRKDPSKSNLVIIYFALILFAVLLISFPTNPDVVDWGSKPNLTLDKSMNTSLPIDFVLQDANSSIPIATLVKRNPIQLGNLSLFQKIGSGVGYVEIGQKYLDSNMCQNYHGEVCPQALDFLSSRDPSNNYAWSTLFNIKSLIVQKGPLLDEAIKQFPNWPTKYFSTDFVQLLNPWVPINQGFVTYRSPGIQSLKQTNYSLDGTDQNYLVEGKGKIMLSDIYWPGWHASISGLDIPIHPEADMLVAIDIPNVSNMLKLHI